MRAYAEKGYKIIYLSTRVSWFSAGVRDWLEDNGFPEGSVHIAQTRSERNRPDVCKTEVLTSYLAHGWSLAYAYGDSSTDQPSMHLLDAEYPTCKVEMLLAPQVECGQCQLCRIAR